MEVPGPRIEPELQLQPMPQLWQCQLLNLVQRSRNSKTFLTCIIKCQEENLHQFKEEELKQGNLTQLCSRRGKETNLALPIVDMPSASFHFENSLPGWSARLLGMKRPHVAKNTTLIPERPLKIILERCIPN